MQASLAIYHLTFNVCLWDNCYGRSDFMVDVVLQVVRSSGVLAYKDKLIAPIKSTIHLKCKEAATLGATVGGIWSVLQHRYEHKKPIIFKNFVTVLYRTLDHAFFLLLYTCSFQNTCCGHQQRFIPWNGEVCWLILEHHQQNICLLG